MKYQCEHCGYIGHCYGTPIIGGKTSSVSAPWCRRCGKNDQLKIYNEPHERRTMDDEIDVVGVEIVQGGLVQIDFHNVTQNKKSRAFCDPDIFFKMMGDSMQRSANKEWMDNFQRESSQHSLGARGT